MIAPSGENGKFEKQSVQNIESMTGGKYIVLLNLISSMLIKT